MLCQSVMGRPAKSSFFCDSSGQSAFSPRAAVAFTSSRSPQRINEIKSQVCRSEGEGEKLVENRLILVGITPGLFKWCELLDLLAAPTP